MKKIFRATAGILTASMIMAGLSGCSGGENPTKGNANTSTTESKDDTAKTGDDKWMIGDPDDPIELTIFMNHTWYQTEEFAGIIPEEITKRTGIKLIPTRATDYTQLGVMASSGELPDLVFTSQMLDTLSDPNICYSYNELIDEYNVDWEIDNSQIINAKAFSEDDDYYFVFSHTSSNKDWESSNAVPMVGSFMYRQDMLEELGNPEINTLEDLDNVFAMIKDKWPDVTPVNFSVDTWWLDPFKTWNGCTLQEFIINDNDEVDIVAKTEPFYNYLKYANSMYQKGYINADNFSWATAERTADFVSGKTFATIGNTQFGPGTYISSLQENVPEAKLLEMKPLSDYPLINSEIGWCGTFITKNNKYPEESLRFLEFLYSEEGQKLSQWGREGTDYTLNDKGLPEFSEEWETSVDKGTNTELFNTNFYLGGSKILEAEARCAVEPEEFQETNKLIKESYTNEEWYIYATPKTKDGDYKVIYDKMVDLVKSGQTKVILSADDAEFESNYKDFIKQLDAIEVDSLAEYMTPKLLEARELFLDN